MPWFDEPKEPREAAPFLVALRAAIERWPPPASPPSFLVAFSGGLDSTLLVSALVRLGLGARIRAAYVDHGLHPDSSAWAERCRTAAAALGIELASVRVAIERMPAHGLEAAARDARYRALGSLLAPGEVLLTAHHGDDQLETVLLRLLRGSGVRGLRGIIPFGPFGHGFLGRPLLGFTRAELHAQALAWGLTWIEDPSNRAVRHDRNFLRRDVLPPLKARWPAAVLHAGRMAEQMSDAEAILDEVAERDAAALTQPRRVPRAVLAALEPARQRNLLRHLLRLAGLGVPSSVKIDELRHALLDTRVDAQPLVRWPGGDGRVFRGELHLLAPLPDPSPRQYAAKVGLHQGWAGPEGELVFVPGDAAPGLPTAWLDEGLTLRFRAGGEQFQPLGRPHRQPLKRWLQEAGIVPWMRGRIPLLFRGDELVAVADRALAAATAAVDTAQPRWVVCWTKHPPLE